MRNYQRLNKESRIVDFLCYLINMRILEIKQDSVFVIVNSHSRFLNGLDYFDKPYALLEAVDREIRIIHEEFDHYISDCKQEIFNLKNLFNTIGEKP